MKKALSRIPMPSFALTLALFKSPPKNTEDLMRGPWAGQTEVMSASLTATLITAKTCFF
jgi:hypothetical protein